jgi:asparagine synthase (glutamine-hydrolysing)
MCGINGILLKQESSDLQARINKMNSLIVHRGPDDSGTFCSNNVAMGMQRLSIIDLSTGHQPMFSKDEKISIVFNGEIYNFKELKEELGTKYNAKFDTYSDTEVILKGYEAWGEEVLGKLNGMFAFSIYDKSKEKIFIARDRFGEKPLYYCKDETQILWASELKSIIVERPNSKQISKTALNLFLSLTYIPAPYTIYEDIYKLKPGHFLSINIPNFEIKEIMYWDVHLPKGSDISSYSTAKKEVRDIVFDSVKKRMIADVSLGVFLSGGVDSTIIAAVMSKVSDVPVKTFSIGYSNPRYDESARARMVADHIKSDHHEYILDYNEVLGELDNIILNFDEPFADSSCIPTYFVSKKTVQHVKVALTGDGGDEVFGGYNKYLIHSYGKLYERWVPEFIRGIISRNFEKVLTNSDTKGIVAKVKKFLRSVGNGTALNHINVISLGFQNAELKSLLNKEFYRNPIEVIRSLIPLITSEIDKSSPLQIARYFDKNISLEGDMLPKVDRVSMLCSLECRAPFLDHRLMELSYKLPDDFLIKGNNKKKILKDAFTDLLPPGFFNNQKSGFEVPISEWFRNELKVDLQQTLSDENLDKHCMFSNAYVSKLMADHIEYGKDNSFKLWTLFCFQKWYNTNA